jgi:hypothetical protein
VGRHEELPWAGGGHRPGIGIRRHARIERQPSCRAVTTALAREDTYDPANTLAVFTRGTAGSLRWRGPGLAGFDGGPDVAGRFDAVGLGPGELIFQRHATAVTGPALLRTEAPAGKALARVRAVGLRLLGRRGQREPERGEQLAGERQCQDHVTQSNSVAWPAPSPHDETRTPEGPDAHQHRSSRSAPRLRPPGSTARSSQQVDETLQVVA